MSPSCLEFTLIWSNIFFKKNFHISRRKKSQIWEKKKNTVVLRNGPKIKKREIPAQSYACAMFLAKLQLCLKTNAELNLDFWYLLECQ